MESNQLITRSLNRIFDLQYHVLLVKIGNFLKFPGDCMVVPFVEITRILNIFL